MKFIQLKVDSESEAIKLISNFGFEDLPKFLRNDVVSAANEMLQILDSLEEYSSNSDAKFDNPLGEYSMECAVRQILKSYPWDSEIVEFPGNHGRGGEDVYELRIANRMVCEFTLPYGFSSIDSRDVARIICCKNSGPLMVFKVIAFLYSTGFNILGDIVSECNPDCDSDSETSEEEIERDATFELIATEPIVAVRFELDFYSEIIQFETVGEIELEFDGAVPVILELVSFNPVTFVVTITDQVTYEPELGQVLSFLIPDKRED